jgi:uncharacterized membrane protein YadS
LLPLFVLSFLACAGIRTTGLVPAAALDITAHLQTLTLGAALFALGTGVQLRALTRSGRPALALGAISTLLITLVSLAWVILVV